MSAKYSIIQFVPDPISDERINIGVIAFDKNTARVKFIDRWNRVQKFANKDIKFIKEFATEFSDSVMEAEYLPGLEQFPKITQEHIQSFASRWINSIQLTEPRSSIKDINSLLDDIVPRFLVIIKKEKRIFRDKRTAAHILREHIRDKLTYRLGDEKTKELFHPESNIMGKRQVHTFDLVVQNQKPYYIAEGLSFELPEAIYLQTNLDALAWSISDVKDKYKELPIGVMTLPPLNNRSKRAKKLYKTAQEVYADLGAEIVEENLLNEWADKVISKIPEATQSRLEPYK